jgi:acyl-CoA thioesterase
VGKAIFGHELGQQTGGFKAQHTWAVAQAWPINMCLFSEKTIESKNRKKGKTFSRLRLSLERPNQSTTTTAVLSYATTTTHRKARPNHSLATHRPSFSPFSLSLLDAESLTLLCSTHSDSTQFQVIVFDFRS